MAAKTLLLTQDPCRSPHFGMTANGFLYQWLDGLLRGTFERAGWRVELAAPRAAGGRFEPEAVATALGLSPDAAGWARLSGIREGTAEADLLDRILDEQFAHAFTGDRAPDLLMGFELPPWLSGWARRHGVDFVCIGPASYRFLPDLLVELNTSNALLHDVAQTLATGRDELERAAARFAAIRRARHQLPLFDEGRIGLLVGQMTVDASLIANGRLARLDAHIDAIRKLAADVDAVFIAPHPYERDRTALHAIAAAVPRASLTAIGTYDLLSAPPVTDVIALSSSVLDEAPLFGARGHRLIQSDRGIFRAASSVGAGSVVLSLDRLQRAVEVLARLHDADRHQPAEAVSGDNSFDQGTPFRDAIDHRWGLEPAPMPSLLEIGKIVHAWRDDDGDCISAASLIENWWGPDGHFNWSSAQTAAVQLRASGITGRRLEIHVAAPAHASAPVIVTATAGALSSRTTLAPGEDARLDLTVMPGALAGGTILRLSLSCDRLTEPLPASPDRRRLGIGLRSIEVVSDLPASGAEDTSSRALTTLGPQHMG